jgi:hypothetical protein
LPIILNKLLQCANTLCTYTCTRQRGHMNVYLDILHAFSVHYHQIHPEILYTFQVIQKRNWRYAFSARVQQTLIQSLMFYITKRTVKRWTNAKRMVNERFVNDEQTLNAMWMVNGEWTIHLFQMFPFYSLVHNN